VDINERILEMRKMAHYQIDLFYEYLEKAGSALKGVNITQTKYLIVDCKRFLNKIIKSFAKILFKFEG
jgi:hypothetical protein